MRIEFAQEGGVVYAPGLQKPTTIDLGQLDAKEAEELRRLVKAADFFNLPSQMGTPARGDADCQHYSLAVIEDDGRRHSVRVLVPVENPALLNLIRAVQTHVKAARLAMRAQTTQPALEKPPIIPSQLPSKPKSDSQTKRKSKPGPDREL